ncbi:YeeE/YedE family protein [Arhodomonas sp. AD133]|uniref:YeeE/YedE family protein n=1 Tax=Arhodomonas sp. AD133 TaxID=3415009 RepID=UPI003EC0E22A
MSIAAFDPWPALVGGVLIGIAATLLLWLNGRIAGISGIAAGAMEERGEERVWRLLFLAGLLGGAALVFVLWPERAALRSGMPWWGVLIAGVLVGFGTRLGSGCTSGHGVCGLGRLSPRSLVAVVTFVATAMVTVFAVRHLLGIAS